MNPDELCASVGRSLPALFECTPCPAGGGSCADTSHVP